MWLRVWPSDREIILYCLGVPGLVPQVLKAEYLSGLGDRDEIAKGEIWSIRESAVPGFENVEGNHNPRNVSSF